MINIPVEPFTNINALIIDMDGVLWHGTQPISGLTDFFQLLREKQLPFILATNNASMTQEQYVNKLSGMGVSVAPNEILTSAMATALYLSQQPDIDPASTRIFVIGEKGAKQPLEELGFTLTDLHKINSAHEDPSKTGADIVVCGLDRELTWDKLATATLNIRAGAKLIGTNGDTTLPTEHGFTPGNGAILAALETATGVKAITIGKPKPILYQQALTLMKVDPTKTIAIGDRLDTDILCAVNTGIRSLLVLTGISTEEDLKTSAYQPTWVMPDIRSVTQALRDQPQNSHL